jgi:hypothetical protein
MQQRELGRTAMAGCEFEEDDGGSGMGKSFHAPSFYFGAVILSGYLNRLS